MFNGIASISNVDFQQIPKQANADNPIWRKTTVRNAWADKDEQKKVYESSQELEAKR